MNSTVLTTFKKNINLNNSNVKNKILQYLYNKQINTKIRCKRISSKEELDNIRDNDYIICPKFIGVRSWIMFLMINDVYYAVNFPKQNANKNNGLRIHPIDLGVSPEFYRGTIMEGIYFCMDEKRYLIVDEVYLLAGKNQLSKSKDDRMDYLSKYFKDSVRSNQNFTICVSHFFQISKQSLYELNNKIKNDTKIRELIFYPKMYGRPIYAYTIVDSDLDDNVVKLTKFRIKKTASPDVYHLMSIDSGEKIDIAYIPNISTSKICRQWFKDYNAKELVVKCQLDNEKKKWIPIELIETDLNDVDDN